MQWTHLRSCYGFTLRVFVGGQAVTLPARWYWCIPGAKPFDGIRGCCESAALSNSEINTDWGEVTPYPTDPNSDTVRTLDRGANPGYPGQCFVGDRQWFIDGQLPGGIMDGPAPAFSPCCRPQAAQATGGIVVGGAALSGRAGLVFTCPLCQAGAPGQFVAVASGGTGVFAIYNGRWTVTYGGRCVWRFKPQQDFLVELAGGGIPGPWYAQFANPLLPSQRTAVYVPQGSFDCFHGSPFALFSQSGAGTPPTLVVRG